MRDLQLKLYKISTKRSLAKSIQSKAAKIKDGTPSLYKLQLTYDVSVTNKTARNRQFIFGKYLFLQLHFQKDV